MQAYLPSWFVILNSWGTLCWVFAVVLLVVVFFLSQKALICSDFLVPLEEDVQRRTLISTHAYILFIYFFLPQYTLHVKRMFLWVFSRCFLVFIKFTAVSFSFQFRLNSFTTALINIRSNLQLSLWYGPIFLWKVFFFSVSIILWSVLLPSGVSIFPSKDNVNFKMLPQSMFMDWLLFFVVKCLGDI